MKSLNNVAAVIESQEEQALRVVMREAKHEAMVRRTRALEAHVQRLREAVQAGVARRKELLGGR